MWEIDARFVIIAIVLGGTVWLCRRHQWLMAPLTVAIAAAGLAYVVLFLK